MLLMQTVKGAAVTYGDAKCDSSHCKVIALASAAVTRRASTLATHNKPEVSSIADGTLLISTKL